MIELTPQNVKAVFTDCLFKEGEPTKNAIIAEGISATFSFHPVRLNQNKDSVASLLSYLPDVFFEHKGGGASFLNACKNSNGELWTGDHATIEMLFVLGLALGFASCILPREFWVLFPGGMPYYVVRIR